MNSQEIEELFSKNDKPDFTGFSDKDLQKIIKHFGLKGSDQPKDKMITLLNRVWPNVRANKLYKDLYEYIEKPENEKAIETIQHLKTILPKILGEPNNDYDSETPLLFAINNNNYDIALEIVKTGHSNPGKVVKGEPAIFNVLDSYLMFSGFSEQRELLPKKKELALALIYSGKSNSEYANDEKTTSLMLACRNKDLLDIAMAIINTGKTDLSLVNSEKITALDELISHELIDNEVFRKLIKYYVLENPQDQHFQKITVKRICGLRKLQKKVVKSLKRVPELENIKLEDYCAEPVLTTAEKPLTPKLQVGKRSNGTPPKVGEKLEEADVIHTTAAIADEDDDSYTDETGRRVIVPLMSQGVGIRLTKRRRTGGKKRKTQIKSNTIKKQR